MTDMKLDGAAVFSLWNSSNFNGNSITSTQDEYEYDVAAPLPTQEETCMICFREHPLEPPFTYFFHRDCILHQLVMSSEKWVHSDALTNEYFARLKLDPPTWWRDFFASLDLDSSSSSMKLLTWESPPPDWIAINTDSSRRLDAAGYGVIARDYKGKVLCAIAGGANPNKGILELELEAVKRVITPAAEMGSTKIKIYSDSGPSVKYINKEIRAPKYLRELLEEIEGMIPVFLDIEFVFMYREINTCAYILSEMPIPFLCEFYIYLLCPPQDLSNAIARDASGCVYLRMK